MSLGPPRGAGDNAAMRPVLAIAALLTCLLPACEEKTAPPPTPTTAVNTRFDTASLAEGASLYQAHCAQCHGPQAQGHPDWQTPSDGSFAAAPPLNGTGMDKSRTRAQLRATVAQGRKQGNEPVMPAFGTRLNAGEIDAVLNYLQSLWPPEVYAAWQAQHGAAAPN